MKRVVMLCLASCVGLNVVCAAVLRIVERTYVSDKPDARIILHCDSLINGTVDPAKITLHNTSGERTVCSKADVSSNRHFLTLIFPINASNFVIFEKLVSDSTGYFLTNEDTISTTAGEVDAGGLKEITLDSLRTIPITSWKKYVLGEYASDYLFSQSFNIGRTLALNDSSKTMYYVDLTQSANYGNTGDWFFFGGLKGRWSTSSQDKLNYIQIYPVVISNSDPSTRIAMSTGVETDYHGFGQGGRGTIGGELQIRLPWNPVDLTQGNPRWRINPVMNIGVHGNLGWANAALPDSIKRSFDLTGDLRYDLPVGRNYYLQTNISGDYSTITKQVQYMYDLSFGYIADGTVRIAAEYKQGYGLVSYQFDKQLMLGFALDVLNQSVTK